jgi:DNA-binding response OmpR family regulator
VSGAPQPRALVAEDDQDIGQLLAHYLQKAGFIPTVVTNGRHVVPRVKREPPDVILLDVMMPGMDGLEVCRALRADPETASVGHHAHRQGRGIDRIVGLGLGADDYIASRSAANEVIARAERC